MEVWTVHTTGTQVLMNALNRNCFRLHSPVLWYTHCQYIGLQLVMLAHKNVKRHHFRNFVISHAQKLASDTHLFNHMVGYVKPTTNAIISSQGCIQKQKSVSRASWVRVNCRYTAIATHCTNVLISTTVAVCSAATIIYRKYIVTCKHIYAWISD
jgi:hypothetical protein